jgi:hypothetical protein
VNACAERHARACSLRHPPCLANPGVAAPHHPVTEIIHNQRCYLRCGINCAGIRERPLQRIAFDAISRGDCSSCGPGVKRSRSMAGHHQSIPDLPLSRSLIRFGERRFYGSTQCWLNCGRAEFSTRYQIEIAPGDSCRFRRGRIRSVWRRFHPSLGSGSVRYYRGV